MMILGTFLTKMPTTVLIESDEIIYICYSLAGRSVLGNTMSEILVMARGHKTEFAVFSKYNMTY